MLGEMAKLFCAFPNAQSYPSSGSVENGCISNIGLLSFRVILPTVAVDGSEIRLTTFLRILYV